MIKKQEPQIVKTFELSDYSKYLVENHINVTGKEFQFMHGLCKHTLSKEIVALSEGRSLDTDHLCFCLLVYLDQSFQN